MFKRLLATAATLAVTACSTFPAGTQSPTTPPQAAQAGHFEGQGSEWRALAESELADRLNRPRREGRARNVILFIADGMSISTLTAARILDGQNRGETGEENYLPFERWGHAALIKTYTENAQVADSAGTASAMMTGVKTHNGAISVYARQSYDACAPGADLPVTLTERAEDRGLATGLVTTARLTHATPAAAYAHLPSRRWESDADLSEAARDAGCRDIARQLIEFPNGNGIDVALGGGRSAFLPEASGGDRLDGRDLTAEWTEAGGVFVGNAAEFRALSEGGEHPVLGLFTDSHLAYEHDRDPSLEPSLSEMTEFAIRRLSRERRGYFLMVEGGRVDHGHHAGNAYRALTDAIAFSEAVETAAGLTDPEDTLIIVTADHGHVFEIAGYPRRGNPIFGLVHPAAPDLSNNPSPPSTARDDRPYTTLGYYNGPVQREPDGAPLSDIIVQNPDFRQESAVPMHSETHSGTDVAAFARGPWAHLVDGVMEQNTLNRIITFAYGWTAEDMPSDEAGPAR